MKINFFISILIVLLLFSGKTVLKNDLLFAGVSKISGKKEIITALKYLCGDYYSDTNLKPGSMATRLRIVSNFIVIADGGQIKGKEYCLVTEIQKENNRYAIRCGKNSLPDRYKKLVKPNARNMNSLFLIERDIGKIVLKKNEKDKAGSIFSK